MKILAFGMHGTVGSRVFALLKDKYDFEIVSRTTGVDITDKESVAKVIAKTDASVICNFSAKANADACEQDKDLGEDGEAWKVNVEGVRNLVSACETNNKKFIHISTDFVFDGENMPNTGYTEDHPTHPVNWYGVTKAKADEIILGSSISSLIIRPAFPYTNFDNQKHFVFALYNRLKNNQPIVAVSDETFTPTWMDDLATALDILLQKNATGLYHIGGASPITPYLAATMIATKFDLETSLISETTREKYFANKAKRPFNTSLNCDKIKKLGVKLTSFEEGLDKIKQSL